MNCDLERFIAAALKFRAPCSAVSTEMEVLIMCTAV